MSIIGQNILAGASAAGEAYTIDQSLRFNDGDSGYLNKTGLSGGSTTKGTQSFWFKRSTISTDQRMWATYEGSSSTRTTIGFQAANKLHIQVGDSAVRISTQVFRDVSAWYHLVIAWDSTQAAAANRCRAYVNGVEITAWDTTSGPTEDGDMHINNGEIRIGQRYTSSLFFDGYIADFNAIDGTQYTASDFGETNVLTNQWVPKKFGGTYGSNGYSLNFSGAMGGYTQLLLHMDGTNDGTTFTDSSQNGHTMVVTGDTHTDTAVKKFGTAAVQFDGVSGAAGDDRLSVTSTSLGDNTYASGTVECWVYFNSFESGSSVHYSPCILGKGDTYWGLFVNASGYVDFFVYTGSHTQLQSSTTLSLDTWHHVAGTWNTSGRKIWIDGVERASSATSVSAMHSDGNGANIAIGLSLIHI